MESTSSLRILVTDDDVTNRQIVVTMLETLGHSAEAAACGEEAIRCFERGYYDMILMDCQMPGLDGFETTRRIREIERAAGRRPTPIVALAGATSDEDRENCRQAGMSEFLDKPISLKQLRAFLSRDKQSPSHAPQSPDALPVVDSSQLLQLQTLNSPGKPDLALELIDYFLASAPQALEDIRASYENRDPSGMAKHAHKLKSTCHNVGARRMARLCERIELGEDGDPGALIAGLPAEYAAVTEELRRFSRRSA